MNASPFAQAAPNLRDRGFTVLPIIPPSVDHHKGRGKAPGHMTPGGHWSGLPRWQTLLQSPPSDFQFGLWLRMADAGVGVVCGTPAGHSPEGEPLGVLGIDIDCDGEELDAIVRTIPATPMAKVGRIGRTQWYRAPASIISRSFDRTATAVAKAKRLVDILAANRQSVMPPSLHASTGAPYHWVGELVAADQLPIFTEDNLTELEEVLETLGWERGGRAASHTAGPRVERVRGAYDDEWAETNGEALARAAEWFPALELPKTRQSRAGIWSAVPIWRESCSGRPTEMRKPNLSISTGQGGAPAGIKDFGASGAEASLTAIDVVQRALDLSAAEAKDWLRERLELDDDSVVVDVAAMLASHDEQDLPAPLRGLGAAPEKNAPPATAGTDVTEGGWGLGGGDTVAKPVSIATHATPLELPEHLLDCPGLVGEITDYITASSRKPQRVLALAAALTIVGTCAGRKYAGPTFSGTHLYVVNLAKSGAGKDHALDMASRIMTAADLTHHIGKGEWMSHQAVFRSLSQQPLTLNPLDELGGFLRRINKRSSGGNEQAITAVLRTAWGKSFKMLPPPGWATQSMEPIFSPALSILGASTHDDFFKAIEAGDTDNGFLNRWLLFSTQSRPPVQKPTADMFDVPAVIVSRMVSIYQAAGNPLAAATMHGSRCDKPMIVAQWADGEDGALNRDYLAWAEKLDEASDSESFFARTAEQALRIATIRAIGCNPSAPVIDRECFAWAKAVALWCAERMLADAKEFMAENQTQSDRARVVRAIRNNSPISHRDLLRKLTTFKGREIEDITKGLEAAEIIRIDPVVSPSNGKKSKVYTFVGDR